MRDHTDIPPLIPMDATAIYLDGNNFTGTLESQAFIGRKRVQYLYLNHSQIEAINNQTFNGLTELEVLHLEDNHIRRLEGYEFGNLTSLRQLFLHNNQLSYMDSRTFSSLSSLEVLQLHGNQLITYPAWKLEPILPSLIHITLSGNAWSCQCDFVHQFQEFAAARQQIADFQLVQCYSPEDEKYISLSDNVTCSDPTVLTYDQSHELLIPILVGILALVIMIACCSLIICVFRTPLRVWLHSKYGIRVCGKSKKKHVYDAFVSYSIKDKEFVQQSLVPQLEQLEPSYSVCLQYRDLPSESSISDTFPGVSHLCAKHIFVVSRSYLDTEWTQIKFAMQDFSKKLKPVIILLEELSSLDLAANPEFNLLLKNSKKVSWNEAGFWNKLHYYLPDAKSCLSDSSSSPQHHSAFRQSTSPSNVVTGCRGFNNQQVPSEWTYDTVIPSNDSSASTRSTIMGGSPRTLGTGDQTMAPPPPPQLQQQQQQQQPHHQVQLVSNPMDLLQSGNAPPLLADHWSDRSDYSYQDHTYQAIPSEQQNIYHTLDQQQQQGYQIPVRLPNGQMVQATLVRNQGGDLVQILQGNSAGGMLVSPPSTPLSIQSGDQERQPLQQQQQQQHPMQTVTFPKTVVYRPQHSGPSSQQHEQLLLQQQHHHHGTRGNNNSSSSNSGHLV